jgi:Concanavalin A-like lectin/glucanases superfamily
MGSSFGVRQRSRSVGVWLRIAFLVAAVAASSCTQSHAKPVAVDTDDGELALLMRDGKLPPEMMPPPAPPPPILPPRFCPQPVDPGIMDPNGPVFPGGPVVRPPVAVAGAPAPTPAGAGGSAAGREMMAGSAGAASPSGAFGEPVDAGMPSEPTPGGSGGSSGFAGTGGLAGRGGVAGGFPIEDGGFPTTPDPACASVPVGNWRFDDCNQFRTDLGDSSFEGHTAFRSVELTCAAGKQGLAAQFKAKEDLVFVPDQPSYVLDFGVTIAAWVKPDSIDTTQTLFRKSEDQDSSFALAIHNRKYEFAIRLTSGRLVSVSAPAKAGEWSHVAGTYDGTVLRLYVDGVQVKSARAAGTLARSSGPLLMGNDGSSRRFAGRIDNVWFNTQAAPAAAIGAMLCTRVDPIVTVDPAMGPSVEAGTAVTYTLSIDNGDDPRCPTASYQVFASPFQTGFIVDPSFLNVGVTAGETSAIDFKVTSGTETEPGTYTIDFQVISNDGGGIFPPGFPVGSFPAGVGTVVQASTATVVTAQAGSAGAGTAGAAGGGAEEPIPPGPTGFVNVQATYTVAEPTGCHVSSQRELMIRDVSVVEDPVRTVFGAPGDAKTAGVWSFGGLMERLSPTPADAADNTEAMFRSFLTPQNVNGFQIPIRPPMEQQVLAAWPRTADGKLDLARAPMRLLAITHRLDLDDMPNSKAGEGRFTFGVLDPFGNPMEFTVIFEYALHAETPEQQRAWIDRIHALQAFKFPSPEYNEALQAITDAFSGRGVLPGAPNGSALIDIRTNEIALSLDGQWQLREFRILPESGMMTPHTIFQTPDQSFNGTEALGRFINENEEIILTERHEVPLQFEGVPFGTGAVFNNIDFWSAPNVTNPEARHKFSLNTCNGCHGAESGTIFLQISPRVPGQPSTLSGFLTGTDVFDPMTGQMRHLNELARRRGLVEAVVCADEP